VPVFFFAAFLLSIAFAHDGVSPESVGGWNSGILRASFLRFSSCDLLFFQFALALVEL